MELKHPHENYSLKIDHILLRGHEIPLNLVSEFCARTFLKNNPYSLDSTKFGSILNKF